MADGLSDLSRFTLSVAIDLYHIMKLLLDFLEGAAVRGPALDEAVVAAVLAVAVFYLVFLYVHANQAAAALWRFVAQAVALVAALLIFVEVPLVAFLLTGGAW